MEFVNSIWIVLCFFIKKHKACSAIHILSNLPNPLGFLRGFLSLRYVERRKEISCLQDLLKISELSNL